MIQQIISHTPLYVWALLGFLVYRGLLASKDREVALGKLFIIPVVMLVISLAGMPRAGALGNAVWALWLAAMLAGAALTFKLGKPVVVHRAAGTVLQRGSWAPLVLMLAIFVTKYAVAVFSTMHPEALRQLGFVVTVTLLFGLFNGVFVGRLAAALAAYSRPGTALAA